MCTSRVHLHSDGVQPLPAKIATLIDCAGSARRRAADYQQLARETPRHHNEHLSGAARNIENARWYLRLAHDRNAERLQS